MISAAVYKVWVGEHLNGLVFDESDGFFRIDSNLVITSPVDGETWYPGQVKEITWYVRGGIFSGFQLQLLHLGSQGPIVSGEAAAEDRSMEIVVPSTATPGEYALAIRGVRPSVDMSDYAVCCPIILAADGTPPSISSGLADQKIKQLSQLRFAYTDNQSGVNVSSVKVLVDSVEITNYLTVTETGCYFNGTSASELGPLLKGTHTIRIEVRDRSGNLATSQLVVKATGGAKK
jgi:hypothetical protein